MFPFTYEFFLSFVTFTKYFFLFSVVNYLFHFFQKPFLRTPQQEFLNSISLAKMIRRRARRRVAIVRNIQQKRPIDKQIFNIGIIGVASPIASNYNNIGPAGASLTYAGTVTGLRVHFSSIHTTAQGFYTWAIIHGLDGQAPNVVLNSSTNGSLYQPEQNVLLWDAGICPNAAAGNNPIDKTLVTKTMRKMKIGDTLYLVYAYFNATAGNAVNASWTTQYFYKS